MPGHLRDRRVAGVKWASTLNRNPGRGLPKVRAAILVSDADTGHLTAILDAKEITALRTGALAAVTAKYCARQGAAAAAIIGFGAVGKGALHTLAALCALQRFAVTIGDSDLTAQRFHIAEVSIAGLDLHVRRERDGTLNLQHLAPAAGALATALVLTRWPVTGSI